ncbi:MULTISPECIES: lactate utilization protein C [unclassified Streptomyces]|uniref:LutC/YkgG family protein n=1 Tax=unclassified Streptomyces TaxID=2593676 RepID=UPI002E1591EA|nr:lactate utilization protein C [Streptomyces sp. NBC_01197]WSS52765.1 lactate utilization protein C [Streptomyces sp. NBC_01180]
MTTEPDSRERILARVRSALSHNADAHNADAHNASASAGIECDYLTSHTADEPATVLDLLHENLVDYRAVVRRCAATELPGVIGELLGRHGARSVAVPEGLPAPWLSMTHVEQHHDSVGCRLPPKQLDAIDAVITGCALAIAETGTIVLDTGPGQGRRALTLVPDLHICVVRAPDQVVASVPQAMPRLDPARPLTWISGPSATSDIELDRVEGVHGPRRLEVVLLSVS